MAHPPRHSREHRSSRERSSRDRSSREYTEKRRGSRRASGSGRALPQYNHNGHQVTSGVHPDGESGRRGFHPFKFLVITAKSSSTLSKMTNLLWPIVPVAIALVCTLTPFFADHILTTPSALRQTRMAPRHLHYKLHRHDPRRQRTWIRRTGAVSQDAPKSDCCRS